MTPRSLIPKGGLTPPAPPGVYRHRFFSVSIATAQNKFSDLPSTGIRMCELFGTFMLVKFAFFYLQRAYTSFTVPQRQSKHPKRPARASPDFHGSENGVHGSSRHTNRSVTASYDLHGG